MLGVCALPYLLTSVVASAPVVAPSACSAVSPSSKTHEPTTASGSPLYFSNGSFMLRVRTQVLLEMHTVVVNVAGTLLRLPSDKPIKPTQT